MTVTLALRFVAVFVFSFASSVFVQNANIPAQKSLPKDYSFKFEASQIWTDTGLDLDRGIESISPEPSWAVRAPPRRESTPAPCFGSRRSLIGRSASGEARIGAASA